MGRLGPLEIAVLVGLALLLFGGSRIAGIGKGLGEGIKNFKKGLKEGDEESPQLGEGGAKSAKDDASSDKVATEKT